MVNIMGRLIGGEAIDSYRTSERMHPITGVAFWAAVLLSIPFGFATICIFAAVFFNPFGGYLLDAGLGRLAICAGAMFVPWATYGFLRAMRQKFGTLICVTLAFGILTESVLGFLAIRLSIDYFWPS